MLFKDSEALFHLFVPGIPCGAGSKRALQNPHSGKISVIDASKKSRPWKERVSHRAEAVWAGAPLDVPLVLALRFVFPRPKGHYRTGRNAHLLRASAPTFPRGKPDTTKLIRGTEDSLTGILWRDDALIVRQTATKVYGSKPGVLIRVWRAE